MYVIKQYVAVFTPSLNTPIIPSFSLTKNKEAPHYVQYIHFQRKDYVTSLKFKHDC